MALRILVSDNIAAEGIDKLQSYEDVEVVVETGWSPSELCEAIVDFDGLVVRSGTQVTRDVIEAGTRLKVIGRAGVGIDNIDLEAATKRGILVLNTPEGNTVSTAEHTIAMMMSLARKIPMAYKSLTVDRRWDRKRFIGTQLQGKVLGVVGLGRIGSEVAKRARALEMQVLAHDPFVTEGRAKKLDVELADVDTICARADFITVHTPLTKATEGLIGGAQFDLMKDGVHVLNCARGGIIDEKALLEALESGKLGGAALDVFVVEPPFDNALLDHAKVIATPHLGASTTEAQISVAVDVAESLIRALRGEPVANAVNAPFPRGARAEGVLPYMDLAERLGRFFTEVVGGGFGKLEVIYSGETAQLDSEPLTTSVLKGMLNPILHEEVNLVNARVLASERSLRVSETRHELDGDYAGLITIRGINGDVERQVAGTLIEGQSPTLVMVDGYRVNVSTSGRLLVAFNQDRPGTIGKVGTMLGLNGINIAFMQVGRKTVGGYAVMVLGIDNTIPEEIMGALADFEELRDVRLVEW